MGTQGNKLKRFRVPIIIAAVLLLVLAWQAFQVFYGSNEFVDEHEKVFYVSRGQTFSSVVDSLESRGIIRSRSLFVFVAKILGGTNRIQVGKYIFASGISNVKLYLSIREGSGREFIRVTIREGLRARSQAGIFARAIGIDSTRYMSLVHDESFTRSLGIQASSLEGYLFPETYSFFWQPEEKEVIERLVSQFKRFYSDSLQQRASELGFSTHEVVAMASIVEGETSIREERPIVSGVYHNRLRKGMRLEADPTIQFFLEGGPRRVVYSDLKTRNPYNTYLFKGLPPGPVNNPGRAAILASLYPAHHDYYFFVADGKGGHWFSSTYAEHLRYVRIYRRNRARGALSSLNKAEAPKEAPAQN